MATPAELQSELDESLIKLVRSANYEHATLDEHYVVGQAAPYTGRSMWVQTTAGDSAADQATTIRSALTTFR